MKTMNACGVGRLGGCRGQWRGEISRRLVASICCRNPNRATKLLHTDLLQKYFSQRPRRLALPSQLSRPAPWNCTFPPVHLKNGSQIRSSWISGAPNWRGSQFPGYEQFVRTRSKSPPKTFAVIPSISSPLWLSDSLNSSPLFWRRTVTIGRPSSDQTEGIIQNETKRWARSLNRSHAKSLSSWINIRLLTAVQSHPPHTCLLHSPNLRITLTRNMLAEGEVPSSTPISALIRSSTSSCSSIATTPPPPKARCRCWRWIGDPWRLSQFVKNVNEEAGEGWVFCFVGRTGDVRR